MNEQTTDVVNKIPQEMIDIFFGCINEKLKQAREGHGVEMLPMHVASILHSTLGGILINYFTNHVEPQLRDYLASKMMFSLSGLLHSHLETLEVNKEPPTVLDTNKSV
jgi:hypothetical protein